MSKPAVLGIIGGSGVYKMDGVGATKHHDITTPFGKPSDQIIEADVDGRTVFFLPRHGVGHVYTPSEVNYRANIYAMKQLGVTHLMAVSAVGIMKEHIKPGDMVIPDQIFDRTKGLRPSTFFGDGVVGHVMFGTPFCNTFRELIDVSARGCDATVHKSGLYVCMEGPQFSTKGESNAYRNNLDATVIGMTAIPEAKLAREAEMCYGLLALATDYDCWHESEEEVSVEAVVAVMQANAKRANSIIRKVSKTLPQSTSCSCDEAAKMAIITSPDKISAEAKKRLSLLYGKYFG